MELNPRPSTPDSRTPLSCGGGGVFSGVDRRLRFVCLARGPVESHDPVVGLLFVLSGKEDAVALADGVEEMLATFQV